MTTLDRFRKDKDDFYAHYPDSPLTRDQKKAFKGLKYFPENPALSLEVTVEPFAEQKTITMQTSTGDVQDYQRFGRFTFTVDGQEAELTIYATGHEYFLPFADSLAGSETYPAGRYPQFLLIGGRCKIQYFIFIKNPY